MDNIYIFFLMRIYRAVFMTEIFRENSRVVQNDEYYVFQRSDSVKQFKRISIYHYAKFTGA